MKAFVMCLAVLAALLFCISCERDKAGDQPGSSPQGATPKVSNEQPAEASDTPADTAHGESDAAEAEADTSETEMDDTADMIGTGTPEVSADDSAAAADAGSTADTTLVMLETTAGDIKIEVHPEWAPVGAEHFLMLINDGYYDGAPFFRVVEGFMAQAGFSGNFELTSKHLGKSIADDPVIMGNYRYTLSFGNTGAPNSRSTHIFINFNDNNMLDMQRAPFPAFAKVIDGFDAVDSIYITGEMPGHVQGQLAQSGGIDWYKNQYPDATVIKKAYVIE